MANNTDGITATEAADRLGISRSWLYELTTKGHVRRNDDGSYPWPEIREDYQEYQDELQERSRNGDGANDDYERARARKTEAMARLKELRIAELEGRLVPIEEVEDRIREPLEAIDRGLSSAPQRLAAHWAERLDITQGEAISLIGDLVDDVRGSVRRELDRLGEELDEEPTPSPLPDDFPARAWLAKAGVETLSELRAVEDLTDLRGIGEKRAEQIREVIDGGHRE